MIQLARVFIFQWIFFISKICLFNFANGFLISKICPFDFANGFLIFIMDV